MEEGKIELIESGKQGIYDRNTSTEMLVNKQLRTFEKLLVNKILEFYKKAPVEEITEIINKNFTIQAKIEIDELFSKLQQSELTFYESRLKTAELVFNTIDDNRTKTIYLDNVLKKIEQKSVNLTEQLLSLNGSEDDSKDDIFGIDSLFEHSVECLIQTLELSPDDADDIKQLANRYYKKLKHDMFISMEDLLKENQFIIGRSIEEKMDEQKLRNGKTTAMSRLEKKLTDKTLIKMEELLKLIVEQNKQKAKGQLKTYSSLMVASIFELLPVEYQNQKELLEVIVDTNINERLGSAIDNELKKLERNLSEKNQDQLQNEFYEEKRYKNIPTYICDFDLVSKVYAEVLHEVVIAYDIPKDDLRTGNHSSAKRIGMRILGEINSTKDIFKSLVDAIIADNHRFLEKIKVEMHEVRAIESQKLIVTTNGIDSNYGNLNSDGVNLKK